MASKKRQRKKNIDGELRETKKEVSEAAIRQNKKPIQDEDQDDQLKQEQDQQDEPSDLDADDCIIEDLFADLGKISNERDEFKAKYEKALTEVEIANNKILEYEKKNMELIKNEKKSLADFYEGWISDLIPERDQERESKNVYITTTSWYCYQCNEYTFPFNTNYPEKNTIPII